MTTTAEILKGIARVSRAVEGVAPSTGAFGATPNAAGGTPALPKSLPDGWRWVKLGEICERIDYGFTVSADFSANDSPRLLRITDIQNGRVAWDKVPGCKITADEEAEHLLADGDIVFARTGATTGKSFLIRNPLRAVFASYLIRLRLKAEIDAEFIYGFFQSAGYWQQIQAKARGGAQPNVNATLLAALEIPLPPLAEQKRIAEILKEQMAAVERARASAEAQLQAAEHLPAAYLHAVFNNGQSDSWPRKRLGEVLELRQEIIHPYNNPSGSATFVGLEHIQSITGARTGSVALEMSELTGRKPRFYKGDIVYGYLRPYLNKVWLAEFDGLCSVDQYVFKVDGTKADTTFVWSFMRSPVYLERAPIGLIQSQLPRIRTEEVASVEINLPSLADQRRIAAQLSSQMESAERLRQTLTDQLDAINKLPAALLRRAFNGEI